MSWYQQTTAEIARLINGQLAEPLALAADLIVPPQAELGDLSWPCFAAAKKIGQTPGALAQDLVAKLSEVGSPLIAGWQAVGPYLNLRLNAQNVAIGVLAEIEAALVDYGRSNDGQGRRIMIEYSNANTHKEYHIGHLRNLFFGDSIQRILNFVGYQAIPVSYLNDFGIHAAKVLWKLNQQPINQLVPENRGYYLGQLYAQASQELPNDPVGQGLVGAIMKRLEAKQQPEYGRWQETRQWSVDQFNKIYSQLNIKFEQTFFESDYLDQGRQLVEKMLADGRLEKSQGAVLANLEAEKLGVLLFLRSDGTALYPVADLPLAQDKFNKYQLAESWYVIDERQSLYFQQLAAVLSLLGINQPIRHLSYSFVKLPTGMMASRQGNVITYEQLKQELLDKELAEINSRHSDWTEEQQQQTAWQVVVGALKFEMIKVGPEKPITFDLNQALSFDGFTAAYIQYAAVRLAAILRQTGVVDEPLDANWALEPLEKMILLSLARFSQIVSQAGQQADPSVLAKYLFELAQQFNDYYQRVRIIGSAEQAFRLRLAAAIRQVLINGLNLLGINVPKVM
ncbi:arginine--tRNA ligase [Candidatus Falkowbacteria bacterium]|nr:arginine--tRNA ligase [Candidatus Falkowbacteria bacterium]